MFRIFLILLLVASILNAAQIVSMTGTGFVNGKKATLGMRVEMGERVKADNESTITVKLANGTGINIKNGTEILISEYPAKLEIDDVVDPNYIPKTRIRLIRGYIQALVNKGSDFKIATPTATAAVRGTTFFVSHNDAGSYFCTCNGSVDYITVGDNITKNITTEHHKGFFVSNGGEISLDTKIEDHTDEEIAKLVKDISSN